MIFTETLDRCAVCPSVGMYTPRTLCVPVICNRLQIMQSGSMTLLTTINIVLGAFGGEVTNLGGVPPRKWPVCNTVDSCSNGLSSAD